MYIIPLNTEVDAPTTRATVTDVERASVVRIVNTITTASLLSFVKIITQNTSANNFPAVDTLTMDSVDGIEVGDVATAAGITAGTTVISIVGLVVTLSAVLVSGINAPDTPIQFDSITATTSLAPSEVLVIEKAPANALFAGAATVKFTKIAYPKG
jgi:hypothetical protein|tara:strand:+ start:6059 stop:6526 length:468 start_codon:yes stop_codon:yes gene_type:complete